MAAEIEAAAVALSVRMVDVTRTLAGTTLTETLLGDTCSVFARLAW